MNNFRSRFNSRSKPFFKKGFYHRKRVHPPTNFALYPTYNLSRHKPTLFQIIRTENNIIFTYSYLNGRLIYQGTAGSFGLQGGSRRIAPLSAEIAVRKMLRFIETRGYGYITVRIIGLLDRVSRHITRAIRNSAVYVSMFHHLKPTPHNGVKLKRPRRT